MLATFSSIEVFVCVCFSQTDCGFGLAIIISKSPEQQPLKQHNASKVIIDEKQGQRGGGDTNYHSPSVMDPGGSVNVDDTTKTNSRLVK